MRCPKCGYVSFDHLEQCLKCKKDISAVSNTLHGTVFNVVSPSFLHISSRGDEDSADEEGVADSLEADDEFSDDDFEVLEDDESPKGAEVVATGDKEDVLPRRDENSPVDDTDSEDREIEIDLSQFEGRDGLKGMLAETKAHLKEPELQPLSLELPAELDDISDLAPPSQRIHAEKSASKPVAEKGADISDFDDLDFDLGLGDLSADLVSRDSHPAKETMLAFDDIDFSETPAKSRPKSSGKPSGADMDEDLNFDLDLGGLSLHKDR